MQSLLMIGHRRIELAIDRMETLLDQVETVPLAAIVDARWAYARQILTHLDHEDAHVYAPLAGDHRPGAVETAALFRAERESLAERFRDHARRYWLDKTINADRLGYAAGLWPNIAMVRDMIRREEAMLYPLIAEAKTAARTGDGKWIADAWRYRAAAPSVR